MGRTFTREQRKRYRKHFNAKTHFQTFNRKLNADAHEAYVDFDYQEFYLNSCRKKAAHATYKAAAIAKSKSEEKYNKKLEIYQCPICGKFHLTSKGWADSGYLTAGKPESDDKEAS